MNLLYLIIAVLVLLCISLAFLFMRKIKAMNVIIRGVDLIKEQDLGSRLLPVGQRDADKIIDLFNRMMSQLKEEKLKLKEQDYLLNRLIENSPMGVVILDFDERISLVNRAAEDFMGTTEIIGKKISELHSNLAGEIAKIPQGQQAVVRFSNTEVYRCSKLSFMDRGFSRPFILIENIAAELMEAEQKAYGKVIRMMAHEVNNTTAGLITSLTALEEAIAEVPDLEDGAAVLNASMERCQKMNRFINRFAEVARIPEPQLRREDLNACITSCKRFLESMCVEKGIALELNLCPEPPYVPLDAALFEQVLVNIIKNSVESITGDGGRICISTYGTGDAAHKPTCSSDDATATSITATRQTLIEITDNGCGIPADAAQQLFTPFFTTKPYGQGLGLTLIREILTKHNCTYQLHTGSDGLTHFKIGF